MMIQFQEDEVCRLKRALTYYRDHVTGSEEIQERYDVLIKKLCAYGEEISPLSLMCDK